MKFCNGDIARVKLQELVLLIFLTGPSMALLFFISSNESVLSKFADTNKAGILMGQKKL
jgi:hypothetical protein